MSRRPVQPAVSTFVIRVWQDWSLSGPRWYGRIEHLQSGRRLSFQEPEPILAFIRASGLFADDQDRDTGDANLEDRS